MAAATSNQKVESFEGRRAPAASFRIPPAQAATLKALFCEQECDAGLASVAYGDRDAFTSGSPGNDPEPIHMFDAESWCDRQRVFSSTGRAAQIHAAREALLDMIDRGLSPLVTVLHRMHGPRDPNARHDLFGELAPVVEMTATVESRGNELEVERKRAARDRFDAYWNGEEPDARRFALATVVSDCRTDSGISLRDGIDVHVHPRDGESRASFAERQMARNGDRATFVASCIKDADRLVVEASRAYLAALGYQ